MNIYLAGSVSAPRACESWSAAIQAAGHTALRAARQDTQSFKRGWEDLRRAHHVVVLVGDGYPATAPERLELATLWCLALMDDPGLRALSWVRVGQTPRTGPWTTHPDRVATDPAGWLAALTESTAALADRVERDRPLETWVVDDVLASQGEEHPATDLARLAFAAMMRPGDRVKMLTALLQRLERSRPTHADTVDCALVLAGAYPWSTDPEPGILVRSWAPRAVEAGVVNPALEYLHGNGLVSARDERDPLQCEEAIPWLERSLATWTAWRGKTFVETENARFWLGEALVGAGRFEEGAKLLDESAALQEAARGDAEEIALVRGKAMAVRAMGGDTALITSALDLAATFRHDWTATAVRKLAVKARMMHPVDGWLKVMIKRAQAEEWAALDVLVLQVTEALEAAGDGEDLGAMRRLAGFVRQLKQYVDSSPLLNRSVALLKRFPHVKPLAKAKAPALKEITDHPAVELLFRSTDPASIPLGASKAAGDPDLPVDMDWPVAAAGPAVFLLQIRLSEVHAIPGREQLPARGMLWFFLGESAKRKPVDLLRYGSEDAVLVRTPPPKKPACSWSKPSTWRPCAVSFAPLTLRSATRWRLTRVMGGMTSEQLDKLEDGGKLGPWASDIPVEGRSWLGGVPCVSQADDPFDAVAADAVFLAQIGYSDKTGWMNGDGGQHVWFMQKAPLADGVVAGAGVVADCS